jgi:hypothetical protein
MATAIWSQLAPLMGWKVDVAMAEPAKWRILQQRANLLRDAWLAKIGHKRPSVPAGVPLSQAEARSAALLKEFLK